MRVVAAMSGGVDSSVVAGLLVEQGHDVIGVHMKLHDAPAHVPGGGDGKHCCGLDDALDARRVADRLGIPFYVMDLRREFERAVMDYFAETYAQGGTPNPCIQCNGVLKFRVLLQRATALGASHLATGHYARISERGGLMAAADPNKDQSYFLFPVTPGALARTLFPLGELSKPEVRDIARRLGLVTADKPESQEVCFIPDDDHTRFVREHRGAPIEGAGDIVDESGTVLGQHDGYYRFTIGQRRGLGIAAAHPLYVLNIQPDTRQVVVGPADRLLEREIVATGLNWFREPEPGEALTARIRHRGAMHRCTIVSRDPLTLSLQSPARGVAPGQAVVLYVGDEVIGGGWIQRRRR
ncbi:MAG: tRNA-specific 2-thiouridylase [Myxococcota bacterium]|jgi:tRNA-specific 2-thiouridylase